jgi:hypothetical protein
MVVLASGCAVSKYAGLKDDVQFEVVVYEGVSYSAAYSAAYQAVGTYFVIVEESKFAGVIVSGFRHGWYEGAGAGKPRSEYQEKALVGLEKLDDGGIEIRVAVTRYTQEVQDIYESPNMGPELIKELVPDEPDTYARQFLIREISGYLRKQPRERRIIDPKRLHPEINTGPK